ncbi:MAG: YdcF family protein [Candidatus Edwardsbacteria bacterium]|jgi:uncharacterized SAM-binding protein YcdF (DUF218 family)|nr:YdcF family protein [Candidatus Edwardsbacteria bacterium]
MTFVLKRVLGDLLQPLPLLLLVVAAGAVLLALRRRRSGAAVLAVAAVLLACLSYGWPADRWLGDLERRHPPLADAAPHRAVRWAVVLGGGLVSDPRLPVTGQLTDGAQLRLVEGVRLYRQLAGAKLLVSGGPVFDDVPESRALAGLAEALGVPPADIVQDSLSLDTEQQAREVRRLTGGDSLLLVTSAYHMPRSLALFRKAGLPCLAAPTHFLVKNRTRPSPDRLFPDSGAIRRAEALCHELAGMVWSRLRGRI